MIWSVVLVLWLGSRDRLKGIFLVSLVRKDEGWRGWPWYIGECSYLVSLSQLATKLLLSTRSNHPDFNLKPPEGVVRSIQLAVQLYLLSAKSTERVKYFLRQSSSLFFSIPGSVYCYVEYPLSFLLSPWFSVLHSCHGAVYTPYVDLT